MRACMGKWLRSGEPSPCVIKLEKTGKLSGVSLKCWKIPTDESIITAVRGIRLWMKLLTVNVNCDRLLR